MTLHQHKFSWNGNETLRDEIIAAGKKYYDEAEKLPHKGMTRTKKIFEVGVNVNRGFEHTDPETMELYYAFKHLGELTDKACTEQNIHISLVRLATLREGGKWDKEKKLREQNFEKSLKRAKKYGQYIKV